MFNQAEYFRKWRANPVNMGKHRLESRIYALSHPEKVSSAQKKSRALHPDVVLREHKRHIQHDKEINAPMINSKYSRTRWSLDDETWLLENKGKMSRMNLALTLGRSFKAINARLDLLHQSMKGD